MRHPMQAQDKQVWRSPEEIVEIGFQRSRVVMMNEAHDGFTRCIRTRQIGQRILPTAHRLGVRHLAMEALHAKFAEMCNETRHVPLDKYAGSYLGQAEMIKFIQAALNLGWTIIHYEADNNKWFKNKYGIDIQNSPDAHQKHQAELLSMEFTNWREEQQAQNLISALQSLPDHTQLLVWCGNGHHSKEVVQDWKPMGYQFQQMSGMNPFVIDQIRTVKFDFGGDAFATEFAIEHAEELNKHGGTAGFLEEETPSVFPQDNIVDAFLLSTQNEME